MSKDESADTMFGDRLSKFTEAFKKINDQILSVQAYAIDVTKRWPNKPGAPRAPREVVNLMGAIVGLIQAWTEMVESVHPVVETSKRGMCVAKGILQSMLDDPSRRVPELMRVVDNIEAQVAKDMNEIAQSISQGASASMEEPKSDSLDLGFSREGPTEMKIVDPKDSDTKGDRKDVSFEKWLGA